MIVRTSSCCHIHTQHSGCRTATNAADHPQVLAVRQPPIRPVVEPEPPRCWWRQIIAYLRRWSGDDAYERYLAEHQQHGHALLSRREFYKRYLDHRAGGSRCC